MPAPEPTPLVIPSPRGERISGLLHAPDPAIELPRVVVLSPCFTCTRDIAPVRNLARDLADAGYHAYRYDPVGSGQSEGLFEEATVSRYVEDLVEICRFLAQRRRATLILAGHSLGGVVSLLAARDLDPKAIVTLATNARSDAIVRLLGADAFERAEREGSVPFDSGDGVIRPLTRAFVQDLSRHDVLDAARELACPVGVVHGDADAIVPLEAARALAAVARKSQLAVVPGAGHLLSRPADRAKVRELVVSFLESTL